MNDSDSASSDIRLPPGPNCSRWNVTWQVLKNPRRAFEQWRDQYGDPFFVHALNGPIVVTGRPDLIREIFTHDPMNYEVFGTRAIRPVLGAGSMLSMDGMRHRRERKLVMPMFHGTRMRAYGDIIRDATLTEMSVIEPDSVFEMLDLTTRISLQVIVKAILGGEEASTINRLMDLACEVVRRSHPILFFSPKMQRHFFGLSPWDRFTKARDQLRNAFDDELARRQAFPAERQ
ncbi:MAG: cytochrome P450, partial [Planctomycetota bacterium]